MNLITIAVTSEEGDLVAAYRTMRADCRPACLVFAKGLAQNAEKERRSKLHMISAESDRMPRHNRAVAMPSLRLVTGGAS